MTTVTEKNGKYYCTDGMGVEYVLDTSTNSWNPILGDNNGGSSKKKNNKSKHSPRPSASPRRGVLGLICHWTVKILTFPIVAAGHILEQFYGEDAPGRQALGAIALVLGVLLGADNIWQIGGEPLFPWFEASWLGWGGWALIWLHPGFWASIAISMLIQVTQGRALRGKSPEKAKAELDENHYELPTPPTGVIDLTKAYWNDYKASGMRSRHSIGFISIAFWAFEIVSAFHAHWFLAQETAALVIGCFLYTLLKIFAGEIGFTLWQANKG